MGYLDCYITAARTCCKKGGYHGKQACFIDVERIASLQNISSK